MIQAGSPFLFSALKLRFISFDLNYLPVFLLEKNTVGLNPIVTGRTLQNQTLGMLPSGKLRFLHMEIHLLIPEFITNRSLLVLLHLFNSGILKFHLKIGVHATP